MANIDPYSFVPLELTHLNELIQLYKKVFGIRYSVEQMKAKYFNDYTGIRAQGYFAFYKGKAVAFHGAIPQIMQQGKKKELCAQYGDAMTLKAHSGNGLFTKLGELTDERLKEKGVRFVWGFPNQNSEYGYVNKLNWKGHKRMQCFIIPLKKISKEQFQRKSKLLYPAYLKKVKLLLEGYLQNKIAFGSIDIESLGGIERSRDFYNYKSFTPNYFVEINGCTVWVKPVGGLLIGDIELKTEEKLLETIEHLKNLAVKLGLNKIIVQASPKSKLNQWMKVHYASFDSWLIGYKDFNSSLDIDKLQFTYGDLDTF